MDHEEADIEALRDGQDFNRVDENDREDSKQNHGVRKSKVQLGIVNRPQIVLQGIENWAGNLE